MIKLLLSSIFFLFSPVFLSLAIAFEHTFSISGNFIDLHFSKLDLPLAEPEEEEEDEKEPQSNPKEVLSFRYELKSSESLLPNIPLAVLTLADQALYYVAANEPSSQGKVYIDLKDFGLSSTTGIPVLYQNKNLGNFSFRIDELEWLMQMPESFQPASSIQNLNVIREKDNSLTILFSVSSDAFVQNRYWLHCQSDLNEDVSTQEALVRADDFLWPEMLFQSVSPNHLQELVYTLSDFSCQDQVFVSDQWGEKSTLVSIINLEDL